MRKKRKLLLKILYYFFISIIVLILATICLGIVFNASGYQMNWKARKIERTGILLINTPEKDFKLFIDKKEVTVDQSRSINIFTPIYKISMLPGDYDIAITKDGRKPYTQHIKIEPELITKIDSLLLLPDKIPDEKLVDKVISQYLVSPDSKKFCYKTTDGKIFIYNIDRKEDKEMTSLSKYADSKITIYKWDDNSKNVALGLGSKGYYIVNADDLEGSYLLSDKLSFLPSFEDLYFSSKEGEFFGVERGALYRINATQNTTDKVDSAISHVLANKGYIYYLTKENTTIQLDMNTYSKNSVLERFELAGDFKLVSLGSSLFFINDKSLYYIKDKNNLELIDKDVENVFPENSGKGFFYTNGFEIWHYDNSKNEKTILTRFSKVIKNVQEVYDDKYLLYQQGTDINVIKKDGLFNDVINNSVEEIKVFEKNKMLIVEKSDDKTSLKVVSLEIK